jgi:hypothetical protein
MTVNRPTRNAMLQEGRSRIRVFQPPKGFDPLKAPAAELLRFGFPTEPDRAKMPHRHAAWTKLLSGPLEFVQPDLSAPDEPQLHRIAPPRQRGRAGRRREKSLNWSGVYIKPTRGRSFTEIHGEWVVPDAVAPAVPGTGAPAPGKYRCATFIGLDGQRQYLNSSLPQIGTASQIDIDAQGRATRKFYAWWQWWARDQHNSEHLISSVPVKPGDVILCNLVVISPTIVRLTLKNQTTGYLYGPIDVPAPVTEANIQLRVTGATAEWITERPTAFDARHTLFDLPDYGHVPFSNCYAISSSPGSPERAETLDLATLIKMRAIREHPHRSVPVSVAQLMDSQAFTTSYVK